MQNKTIDVLLINLGTPTAATKKAVKAYLREFLSDPRVIDIPNPWRWLLVRGFIIPLRSQQTTHAYQQIWQADGSPLMVHSQQLRAALSQQLGANYRVHLAMCYGSSNILQVLHKINAINCEQLLIVPLYPQYASATTGSALEKTLNVIRRQANIPAIKIINHFYNHPEFITAYADIIKKALSQCNYDYLLFSYHGLPLRHLEKSGCPHNGCDRTQPCLKQDELSSSTHHYCYRQQCYITTQLLVESLNLSAGTYQVSFQSRLGKTPWIQPYTDQLLPLLFTQGKRNLAVVCPSFVCDCLETLEEIGIRLRAEWQQLGGQSFTLIPCLNAEPGWVSALIKMIRAHSTSSRGFAATSPQGER